MRYTIVACAAASFVLGGCSYFGGTKDFLKSLESKAYDSAAVAVSEYCEKLDGPIATQERLEARRELRQRGSDGPDGPVAEVPGLDGKTAHGSGPVVRIWCEGDEVPDGVWKDFVR